MITRRQFLKLAAAAGISMAIPHQWAPGSVQASATIPQTAVPGKEIAKYVEPLPVFGSSEGLAPGQVNAPRQAAGSGTLPVSIVEVQQKVLPADFYKGLAPEHQAGTWVWAYNVNGAAPLYPGITVEARRNSPATLKYSNNLPLSPVLQDLVTTDQSIHWANPLNLPMMDDQRMQPYSGPPPVAVHLHGAEVPSAFDGGPDQWFTPNGIKGAGYATFDSGDPANVSTYQYPNKQEATTLWFHDHTLGATRLNVLRGLAAFYLLRDEYDTGLPDNPLRLPAGPYEREIAIQDRQFDTNGQWFFPEGDTDEGLNGSSPNPLIHPFWNPEFFGDVFVVNGKSWPFLNVEPRRYRFRLLDGCNARFLELRLLNRESDKPGPAIWVIGTDGGLLDQPVMKSAPKSERLLMAPGERYDVMIDFSGYAGQTLTLMNSAKAPYPSGTAPDPQTTAQIMQFRVTLPLKGQDNSFNPASQGARLRGGSHQPPAILRLADPTAGKPGTGVHPAVTRLLTLVEVEGPGGPVEVLVNNTRWNGTRDDDQDTPIPDSDEDDLGNFITELPQVGATEIWEIVNLTMDAHPIHLHLVQFQLMNRQMFNMTQYKKLYDSLFVGGEYGGVEPDDTWGKVDYDKGEMIPAYGPPLPYIPDNNSEKLSGGKLGGNPDVAPFLQGMPMPPRPEEAGWKDTAKMWPGEVTRIVVRFAPQEVAINQVAAGVNKYSFDPTTGPGYVWHCHIVDHEDNEMMRPYHPVP